MSPGRGNESVGNEEHSEADTPEDSEFSRDDTDVFIVRDPGADELRGTQMPYKVIPGNVGYVRKPSLTCTFYVGTTVALAWRAERRKFAPTC